MKHRSDCPLSCTLEILGDKWTLLILRDIFAFHKATFKEFQESDEGIASNILTDRLNLLVDNGILEKTRSPENKKVFLYRPTPKGEDLLPAIKSLVLWGQKYFPGTRRMFDDTL